MYLKEIKDSKVRVKRKKTNREFDTLGITMELEKSLSIGDQLELERKKIKDRKKRRIYKLLIKISILAFILVIATFIIHINKKYKVNSYTQELIRSDSEINIIYDKDNNLVFTPYRHNKKEAVIIYPSSGVEPVGYAGMARKIASKGYKVVVAKVFMNYPFFAFDRADKIINSNPDKNRWYLISHNTSGDVAVKAAASNKKIMGVVFLGTYPSGDDLKLINEPVLTIWGTNDGILDFTKFHAYKNNLPTNADFTEIVGGNNTNFADIKMIAGDNNARISNSIQQDRAAEHIYKFIVRTSR